MMYQIAKENFNKYEKKILEGYLKSLEELDKELDVKYRMIDDLNTGLKHYYTLLYLTFSPDCRELFLGSIEF